MLQPDSTTTEINESLQDAWLVFVESQFLPSPDGGFLWHNLPVPFTGLLQQYTLGSHDGYLVKAVEVAGDIAVQHTLPEGISARNVILQEDGDHGFLFHQAASLVNWGRNYRFCPRCRAPFEIKDQPQDRGRSCGECHFRVYPAVNPCVITLIHRDDHVLLARGLRHPPGFLSLIAGFVEPGETLEQTVAREIKEEVGLEVDNITYQHSQPWPFPNNLMMGFHARYKSGEIALDTEELTHADWYPLNNLPTLPPPQTIAWQLVEKYRQLRQR